MSDLQRQRARLAAMVRHYGREHPDVIRVARELRTASAEQELRRLVLVDPPLTARQLARLRALLRPGHAV